MRCNCCNVLLTDLEATRKFKESGEYTDACTKCLQFISDVPTVEREETQEEEDFLFDEDEGEFNDD